MYTLIKDDELSKKYNDILNKVSNSIKNEFDSEPICNINFWKAKQNLQFTGFHDKELVKVGSKYICLVVISIDFVLLSDFKGM